MVECLDEGAYGAWDKELNTVYKGLMATLDSKAAELLRASQRHWIAYHDAKQLLRKRPWTSGRGTTIRVVIGAANSALVNGRVNALPGLCPDHWAQPA
jgi:uncharacterized protein YecT (DUF1311 family)